MFQLTLALSEGDFPAIIGQMGLGRDAIVLLPTSHVSQGSILRNRPTIKRKRMVLP